MSDLEQINRDIEIFGKGYIEKLKKLKIFVHGLKSIGIEIVKNLAHFQPSLIIIDDENTITNQDLGSCHCYRKADVGNRSRQGVFRMFLKQQFNSKLNVRTFQQYVEDNESNNNNSEEEIKINTPSFLHQFDIVIITEMFDFELLASINEICRTRKQKPVGFIYAGTIGLQSFHFSDFGSDLKINDRDGYDVYPYLIENISKSDPGVVTLNRDKPHTFKTGDFVCITEVEGMKEVNGNESRPVKVIDQFSFSIEDTQDFQQYEKNGLVQVIKVPFKINFVSFKQYMEDFYKGFKTSDQVQILNRQIQVYEQIQQQQKDENNNDSNMDVQQSQQVDYKKINQEKIQRIYQLHLQILAIFKYFKQNEGKLPQINDEKDAEKFLGLIKEIKLEYENNSQDQQSKNKPGLIEIDEKLALLTAQKCQTQFAPLSIYWGAIVSREVLVYIGKYQSINQVLHFDVMDLIPKDSVNTEDIQSFDSRYHDFISIFGTNIQQKLNDLKIAVIGSGGNGCEMLRNFALLGVSAGKGNICLIDDAKLKKYNLNSHPWFSHNEIDQIKTVIVSKKAQDINPDLKLEMINCRANQQNENILDERFWDRLDLIINSSDKKEGHTYLLNKSIWYEKVLFDQNVAGLKGNTNIIVPFQTSTDDLTKQSDYFNNTNYTQNQDNIFEFPYLPVHNILWAKQQFNTYFKNLFSELHIAQQNPTKFFDSFHKQFEQNQKKSLHEIFSQDMQKTNTDIIIKNFLKDTSPAHLTLKNLINFSKELFEVLFNINIQNLLIKHPSQPKSSQTNEQFWVGYKRLPQPLQLSFEDSNATQHTPLRFITICTIILSGIFNIDFKVVEKSAYVEQVLLEIYTLNTENKQEQQKQDSNNNISPSQSLNNIPADYSFQMYDPKPDNIFKFGHPSSYTENIQVNNKEKSKNQNIYEIQQLNPEIETDRNLFVEFLDIASNLRAKCYSLQSIQKNQVLATAFEVDHSCPLTQSLVAGASCFELLNIIQGKKNNEIYQGYYDMAINKYDIIPSQPAKGNSEDPSILQVPKNFTEWDKLKSYGPISLEKLLGNYNESYGITITKVQVENITIWQKDAPNAQDILIKSPEQLFQQITRENIADRSSLELIFEALSNDGKQQCNFSRIKYILNTGK